MSEKENKFAECIHCQNFFSCTDKKYKRDNCLKFVEEREDDNGRCEVDQD